MNDNQSNTDKHILRENFLLSLLNKVVKEYKTLLDFTRRNKPLKIIEISHLSPIPGETKFIIQLTNKNCVLHLTAAELIGNEYSLNDFNDFHAEMIRQAAKGKMIEFLKLIEKEPIYKIVSKRFDSKIEQYLFTLETKENIRFNCTADELSKNKDILSKIDVQDLYDIGYTHGLESILKEKSAMLLAKKGK